MMGKTATDMAPKQRIDLRLTETQLDRVGELAEYLGSKQPDILRDAIDVGLEELEQRVVRRMQFQNAVLVNSKLKRRPECIRAAIALLESGNADPAEIKRLLEESIG
jgi:predicted DNA-binding protein